MAKSRPTIMKRKRELARQDKRRDKAAKRAQRMRASSESGVGASNDLDPDIAHIVPGPQPIPWADEFEDDEEELVDAAVQ